MVPPSTIPDYTLTAVAVVGTIGWERWTRTRYPGRTRTALGSVAALLGVVAALYWTLLRHGYVPWTTGFEQQTPMWRILPAAGAGVICLLVLLVVFARELGRSDEELRA